MLLIQQYGLLGFFLASIISNATIILPIPIDIAVFFSSPLFNPFLLALAVGLGAGIGEMTGYLIGRGIIKGAELAEHKKRFKSIEKIQQKISKWGALFIFLIAVTPFPFDIVGIASGMIKYSWWKVWLAVTCGKVIRVLFIALAGYYGLPYFIQFFT